VTRKDVGTWTPVAYYAAQERAVTSTPGSWPTCQDHTDETFSGLPPPGLTA
jgi:hypothetical protein